MAVMACNDAALMLWVSAVHSTELLGVTTNNKVAHKKQHKQRDTLQWQTTQASTETLAAQRNTQQQPTTNVGYNKTIKW
jgi:hypothetical protein